MRPHAGLGAGPGSRPDAAPAAALTRRPCLTLALPLTLALTLALALTLRLSLRLCLTVQLACRLRAAQVNPNHLTLTLSPSPSTFTVTAHRSPLTSHLSPYSQLVDRADGVPGRVWHLHREWPSGGRVRRPVALAQAWRAPAARAAAGRREQ